MSKKTNTIAKLEVQLARSEGELAALRSRSFEVLHLIYMTTKIHANDILLSERLQELINLQAKCEEEIGKLKHRMAFSRTIKK